jgi:hypothetical protein
MPWKSGKDFAARHNKKLKGAAATKAASQANAMLRSGVPEGIAIATANKTGNKMQSRGDRWYGGEK